MSIPASLLVATMRMNADLAGTASDINDYSMYTSRALAAAEQIAQILENEVIA